MGAAERAEADRPEAAALVDSLSDDELARHLESAARLAGAELYLDRYAEGDAHATRALAVARATGQGELFLVLVQTLGAALAPARQAGRGRRAARRWHRGGAPAGQHARAGVEPLQPFGRRAPGRRRGARARHRPGERRPQRRISTRASTRPRQPSTWPARCSRRGNRNVRSTCSSSSAGGEELVLIAGGPRAHYLELLTRCWLALDRPAEARRAAAAAEAWASVVQLPMARRLGRSSGGGRRPAHGDAARRGRAGARGGGRRRRGRGADRGSALAHARGPRTRPNRRARPRRCGAAARGRGIRGVRRAALP